MICKTSISLDLQLQKNGEDLKPFLLFVFGTPIFAILLCGNFLANSSSFSSGIVVGRLQNEGFLHYSYLNGLKEKYEIY